MHIETKRQLTGTAKNLVLSKSECQAVLKASKIAEKARDLLRDHYTECDIDGFELDMILAHVEHDGLDLSHGVLEIEFEFRTELPSLAEVFRG